MFKIKNNRIEINSSMYDFKFDIRTVIQYKNNYIVLLSIPFNDSEINNVYCLNSNAELLWQSQDLSSLYQNSKNLLPYEQMRMKDGYIYASDFYGRNYKINANNGKIEGFDIVK
jgi:outer membrane protein assembly factor BamB